MRMRRGDTPPKISGSSGPGITIAVSLIVQRTRLGALKRRRNACGCSPRDDSSRGCDRTEMMKILSQIVGRTRLARVRPPVPPVARVAISTAPVFGPWGGGNQWLLQMARFFGYSGYEVGFDLGGEVDCIFIQHNGLTGTMT